MFGGDISELEMDVWWSSSDAIRLVRSQSVRKRMTNRICGAPPEFTSAGSERDFLASVGITAEPSSLQNHVWGTLASFVKIIIKIRQADIADI